MSDKPDPLRVKSADMKLNRQAYPPAARSRSGQYAKKVAAGGAPVRQHRHAPKGTAGAPVRQPQQAHKAPARSPGGRKS
jgi:hypothetical protein